MEFLRAKEYRLIILFSILFLYILDYFQSVQTRLFPFLEINKVFLNLSYNLWISFFIYFFSFAIVYWLLSIMVKYNALKTLKISAIAFIILDIFILYLYLHNLSIISNFEKTFSLYTQSPNEICYLTSFYPNSLYCVFPQNTSGYILPNPNLNIPHI